MRQKITFVISKLKSLKKYLILSFRPTGSVFITALQSIMVKNASKFGRKGINSIEIKQ